MNLKCLALILLCTLNTISLESKSLESKMSKCKSLDQEKKSELSSHSSKEWNFIIYMIGNNLYKFVFENLKEMLEIGSTRFCNILVQIDHAGETEASRFFIEKNKAVLQPMEEERIGLTRGTPASFYFFMKWAIQNYPAKHHAIILWNHASGIKHPNVWEKLYREDRDQLFHINPETGLLELNRRTWSIKQDHDIDSTNQFYREWASSFHQSSETFINEQELRQCMAVCKKLLKGKNVDIVILDACHLAMLEIASILSNKANFMVASQEMEPGSGCNFSMLFEPFIEKTMLPEEFARHAVESFEREYASSFADFTFSAINLQAFDVIEKLFLKLSDLLLKTIKLDNNFWSIIRKIRNSRFFTTEFFDRDYIDLHHFLTSLLTLLQKQDECLFSSKNPELCTEIKNDCLQLIKLLEEKIFSSTAGINLTNARGLSIYFPEKAIHSSYLKTSGIRKSLWADFLSVYIKKCREF